MLKTILLKQIKDYISSSRFTISFGIGLILILMAFLVGGYHFQAETARYNANIAANLKKFEGLTDWLQVNDFYIFLPPRILESLINGISNDIGRTISINDSGELQAINSYYESEPIFAIFQFLDLEFIFLIVLSLLAIIILYDSINGERENGTLSLVLSNPVPKAVYILGKLGGAFIMMCGPVILALGLGSFLLLVIRIPFTEDEFYRFILFLGLGILYYATFLSVSILVSCLTRHSTHSFMILLGIWILSVFIIPRTAVTIVGQTISLPSREEIDYQKRHYQKQLWEEDIIKINQYKPPALSEDQTQAMDQVMEHSFKFMQQLNEERIEKMDQLTRQLNEEYRNRQRHQARTALMIARISPAVVFSLGAATLANTGLELKDFFMEQAEIYQSLFREFKYQKTGATTSGQMRILKFSPGQEKPKPIDLTEIPDFNPQPVPWKTNLRSIIIDFLILILFNLFLIAATIIGFHRYDVRL